MADSRVILDWGHEHSIMYGWILTNSILLIHSNDSKILACTKFANHELAVFQEQFYHTKNSYKNAIN